MSRDPVTLAPDAFEDIVEAVEMSIDRRFPDERLAEIETFGDLVDATLAELRAAHGAEGRRCLNAMAYNRVREAVGGPKPRPSARLRRVWPGRWRDLDRRLKMVVERPAGPAQGWAACVGLLALVLAVIVALEGAAFGGLGVMAAGLLSLALSALLARSAPAPDVTVGALARDLAAWNLNLFAAAGARLDERSVGAALRRLAAHASGYDESGFRAEKAL